MSDPEIEITGPKMKRPSQEGRYKGEAEREDQWGKVAWTALAGYMAGQRARSE